MSLLVDVLSGGVRGGTSIMYAALGETVSERAGVINLGTEGSMLIGALSAYAVGDIETAIRATREALTETEPTTASRHRQTVATA